MTGVLIIALSYLVGSFPSAFIFSRLFKKIDIRSEGSGNVGGMNTYRSAGLLPGILTIIFDILKGVLAVMPAIALQMDQPAVFACAFMAVLGHNYSLFLRFRGGKGLATGLGVFIALSPSTIVFTVLCAFILSLVLKDANTAFGSAALSIPVILGVQYGQWDWVLFGSGIAALIIIKHIPDYHAYIQGRRQLR